MTTDERLEQIDDEIEMTRIKILNIDDHEITDRLIEYRERLIKKMDDLELERENILENR